MPPLHRILPLLSLLFATTTTALPGAPKSPKTQRPGQPWAACEIEEKSPRDAYRLEGINWNVTEAQLKAAINGPVEEGVVLTAWEWKVFTVNEQGVERFEAKFRLPINQGKKTMKRLKKLVEPWEMDITPYPYPVIDG